MCWFKIELFDPLITSNWYKFLKIKQMKKVILFISTSIIAIIIETFRLLQCFELKTRFPNNLTCLYSQDQGSCSTFVVWAHVFTSYSVLRITALWIAVLAGIPAEPPRNVAWTKLLTCTYNQNLLILNKH